MRVVWSFDANNDIEQIWTYLAQNASVDRADRQIIKIVEACRLVSDWPRSGSPRDNIIPGMRSIAAEPYVIFYRVGDEAVQIVRVLDGRRDIEAVLNETS